MLTDTEALKDDRGEVALDTQEKGGGRGQYVWVGKSKRFGVIVGAVVNT